MTPTPIKKCHSSMLVSVSRALKGSPRTKTTLMAASQSHSIPLSGSHYSFNRLSHCPPIHLGLPRVIEPIAGQTEMLPFWIQTLKPSHHAPMAHTKSFMLLLLLSRFSRVRLCATQQTEAHQAPPSLGFSRQEHWSGLPFPSPICRIVTYYKLTCKPFFFLLKNVV